jgi:mono/diheme cytochrome c family protein
MRSAHKKLEWFLQLALVLAFVGAALPAVSAQTKTPQDAQAQLPTLIRSLDGSDLFRVYCATCHGADARGDGPLAPALKTRVPDLTLLSVKNHGQFPAARIHEVISGGVVLLSHGSREMPIWGPIFHQVERDMDWGDVRVTNLVKYLQSIQSNTAPKIPSGAELYSQHCAVCHGGDLKGTNPGPAPFKSPPDLTLLAKTHDGKFPDDYVKDVLRNGVVFKAHGPAEMPVWGTDFTIDRMGENQVAARIANITSYIKSRQRK